MIIIHNDELIHTDNMDDVFDRTNTNAVIVGHTNRGLTYAARYKGMGGK